MSRFYDVLREAGHWEPIIGRGEAALTTTAPVDDPAPAVETVSERRPEMRAPDASPEAQTGPAPQWEIGDKVRVSINGQVRALRHAADPIIVEHYRRLRTKLLQERAAEPFKTLMIASPNPQEGKTVTSLNLALSFSMVPNFRVALVDGDLRKGILGQWLGVEERPGLSDAIEGKTTIEDVILRSSDFPIHFVVRGTSTVSPAELLNSPRAKPCFDELARAFDLVILDSPPLNLVTDGHLLAQCCDAIVLVARAFSTTTKAFEKVVQELQSFRVLGTVLNGGARSDRYRHYNGYSGDKR